MKLKKRCTEKYKSVLKTLRTKRVRNITEALMCRSLRNRTEWSDRREQSCCPGFERVGVYLYDFLSPSYCIRFGRVVVCMCNNPCTDPHKSVTSPRYPSHTSHSIRHYRNVLRAYDACSTLTCRAPMLPCRILPTVSLSPPAITLMHKDKSFPVAGQEKNWWKITSREVKNKREEGGGEIFNALCMKWSGIRDGRLRRIYLTWDTGSALCKSGLNALTVLN